MIETKVVRAAVFAHYDSENRIDDYVVYYLKELKKVAEKIVFVSDCEINEAELAKIKDIAAFSIAEKHGEYDFGSYKRGYFYLKENDLLKDLDELIFANDSCYGPIFSLDKVFCKMNESKCDFWGINFNNIDICPHIQSFFLVFKKQVFKSECFDGFMKSITREENKDDIIEKYEVGLSKALFGAGFRADAFINEPIDREISYNILFGRKNPLIKTCAIDRAYKGFVDIAFKKTDYPKAFILKANRYKMTKKKFLRNLKFLKKVFIKIRLNKREIEFFGQKFRF